MNHFCLILNRFSLVYKIVCKGYKERLFDDLKKLLTEHCQSLKNHLDENVSAVFSSPSKKSCSHIS